MQVSEVQADALTRKRFASGLLLTIDVALVY
jgi:hypothetical protein